MHIKEYYNRRANEYESIYRRDDPIRQHEQEEIGTAVEKSMRNRHVLEIACGTGFWTERAVKTATYILATDAAPRTIDIARSKNLPSSVEFKIADAYSLETLGGTFDAGLAMFWFSHVSKSRMEGFLHGFHAALARGSNVFIADNIYVEGVGGTLIRKPGFDDTFKIRTLPDGSKHEVLKNYYDREMLTDLLSPHAKNLQIEIRSCFWWLQYKTK